MGDEVSVVEKTQEEAAQGVVEAQFLLGQMYERGEVDGTENYNEAEAWYKKAAEQGSGEASYALFNLYNSGENDMTADDAEKVVSRNSRIRVMLSSHWVAITCTESAGSK